MRGRKGERSKGGKGDEMKKRGEEYRRKEG